MYYMLNREEKWGEDKVQQSLKVEFYFHSGFRLLLNAFSPIQERATSITGRDAA
jgi:hypothetical protein